MTFQMFRVIVGALGLASMAQAQTQSEFDRRKQELADQAAQRIQAMRQGVQTGQVSQGVDNIGVQMAADGTVTSTVAASATLEQRQQALRAARQHLQQRIGNGNGSVADTAAAQGIATIATEATTRAAGIQGATVSVIANSQQNSTKVGAVDASAGSDTYDADQGATNREAFLKSADGASLVEKMPVPDPAQSWWGAGKSGVYTFDCTVGMMGVLEQLQHGGKLNLDGQLEEYLMPVPMHLHGAAAQIVNKLTGEVVLANPNITLLFNVYPANTGSRIELRYNQRWSSYSLGRFGSSKWRDLNWPWVNSFVQAMLSQMGSTESREMLLAQLAQVEGELDELQHMMNASVADNTQATQEKLDAIAAYQTALVDLQTAETHVKDVQTTLDQANADNTAAIAALAAAQAAFDLLAPSISAVTATISSIEAQLAAAPAPYTADELAAFDAQLTDLQGQLDADALLVTQTATLQAQIDSITAQLASPYLPVYVRASLLAQQTNLQNQLNALATTLTADQLLAINTQMADIQGQITAGSVGLTADAIAALQAQLLDWQAQLADLVAQQAPAADSLLLAQATATQTQVAVNTATADLVAANTSVVTAQATVVTTLDYANDKTVVDGIVHTGGATVDSTGATLAIANNDQTIITAQARIATLQAQGATLRAQLDQLPQDQVLANANGLAYIRDNNAATTELTAEANGITDDTRTAKAKQARGYSVTTRLQSVADSHGYRTQIEETTVAASSNLTQAAMSDAEANQLQAPADSSQATAERVLAATGSPDLSNVAAYQYQGGVTVADAFRAQQLPMDLSKWQTNVALPAVGGGGFRDSSTPPPVIDPPPGP